MPITSRFNLLRRTSPDQTEAPRPRFRLGGPLARLRRKPDHDLDAMMKRIILPSLPVSDEEMARATHQDLGQKLVRQENWGDLAARIEYADDCRLATPGGEAASMLLAFGARSDVVAAAEDAIHDGTFPDPIGIEALEEMLRDQSGNHACALVAALAHFDIGWAWQTAIEAGQVPDTPESKLRIASHFRRADDILAPFDPVDLDAPSVAAAQCLLLAALPQARHKVADAYERLIDLDPDSPRYMRALGQHLLPAQFGDYQQLELEARRTAARTGDLWGAGAYTWVYLDALAQDDGALSSVDPGYFIEGLKDILGRKREQHIVNVMTAFCAIAMGPDRASQLTGTAEQTRRKLHDCTGWLLSDHLQELHPLIWSQALLPPRLTPALPSRRALITKGRQAALHAIALQFADDIADGSSIAFSPSGMYRLPAL